MRNWLMRIILVIGYCVPYVFLALNGDADKGTMLFYGIMILCFGGLCWLGIKTKNGLVVLIGNGLSCLSSYLFLLQYQTEKWGWYFKPFTGISLMVTVSVIGLLIQSAFVYGSYKKHEKDKGKTLG